MPLEPDTRNLCALEAIRTLKARYFRCVDMKDWAGLEAVFTSDVVFERSTVIGPPDPVTGILSEIPAEGSVVSTGRNSVMERIRNAVEPLRTIHHGFMPEIAIIDDHTASGIWAMRDELRTMDGDLILEGSGHYHERYQCKDGEWAISHIRLSRLFVQYGPAHEGGR
ncbi:MAG: nuclear transport factor 2 family protein [Sphingomonadales bacterium]